jgi:hypothetical protein
MYAMNLNFKLTSQKSKLAHYEENMKNSLYILQWGEQVCAKTTCDANDRLCTQEKFVLAARTPKTPGISPETPDRMSGVSGYVPGVSGPSAQNTENNKSSQFKKHHTII